ncbi:hypothetical protein QBC44DRAFT_36181 [Cladorrhinum sp. PSN332]|nr:hypothetical protein QBC44DRAFT_36181 [Cladorrhinum sp. PSN332]
MASSSSSPPPPSLTDFLSPLSIDTKKVFALSRKFTSNFRKVAAESETQFLPTPITESILRSSPSKNVQNDGRYLAIDIGGTNLRVAFVQPSSSSSTNNNSNSNSSSSQPTLDNHTSHPFPSHFKSSPDLLFSWVGKQIAQTISQSSHLLSPSSSTIPIGVAFSFPMIQTSLSSAKIMQMGKGFGSSDPSNTNTATTKEEEQQEQLLDLAAQITRGYSQHGTTLNLPKLEVVAILNDAVATYITALNRFPSTAAMGLIVGTGCNATVPLPLRALNKNKMEGLQLDLNSSSGGSSNEDDNDEKIVVVNTEWSISGTAPPLRELGIFTRWDDELNSNGGVEIPGFQPLEYMTGGRYLGELVRIVYADWLGLIGESEAVPERFRRVYGVSSEELSKGGKVEGEKNLLEVVLAVQRRAAGIVAAACVGLLRFAGRLDEGEDKELVVGYTGGCIEYFQDYLGDTQRFVDEILEMEYGGKSKVRVVLRPCHDGGIIGAGVLAGAALAGRSS